MISNDLGPIARVLALLNERSKDIGEELDRIEASRAMWEVRLNEVHKAIALIKDDNDARIADPTLKMQ